MIDKGKLARRILLVAIVGAAALSLPRKAHAGIFDLDYDWRKSRAPVCTEMVWIHRDSIEGVCAIKDKAGHNAKYDNRVYACSSECVAFSIYSEQDAKRIKDPSGLRSLYEHEAMHVLGGYVHSEYLNP